MSYESDKKTIIFKKPIVFADQEYTEITLEEPEIGVIENALREKNEVATSVFLIASVAGVPPAVIRKMKSSDFEEAISFLSLKQSG